ncbi:PH domain-containing protein [Niallia circulans]|uniref:PH domain-containing protein n=1 Tax=Niallia circulans TaxID=1397 RepID=UPI00149080BD|nr:PH domain-containing protein [Niallia circulans]QJX60602.1 PH domain-containing protein [Niallia circulans]
MFKQNRLHPVSIIYVILKRLREFIFPFIGIIVLGGKPTDWSLYTILGASLLLLIILISGFLSWYFFTFYVVGNELRMEYGVFIKKKRYIPFERIQSIDFTEGIFHRPFSLVKVKIETAGGAEAEGELTAISKKVAQELKRYIIQKKNEQIETDEMIEEVEPAQQEIYRITSKKLVILASTSGGVGVIISAIFAFISQFDDLIPYKEIYKHVQQVITSGVALVSIVVFVLFVLLWILSWFITILKYANFTLSKTKDDLIITRGLIEKKQITIPLRRIQAIKITEAMLRQPFQLVGVSVISAGGSFDDIEASDVVAVPLLKKKELPLLLKEMVPEYEWNEELLSPPKRSIWRYIIKNSWAALPVIIALIYFFHEWGALSLLLLLVLPLWGYWNYRSAGYRISGKQLTLSFRQFNKTTFLMRRNRIQALYYTEGWWQRKGELASVQGVVLSGAGGATGVVTDLTKEDVEKVYEWYSLS